MGAADQRGRRSALRHPRGAACLDRRPAAGHTDAETRSAAAQRSRNPGVSRAHSSARKQSRGGSRATLDGHKYVGFEDHFRGSQDDIRGRVAEYLPIFRGVQNVVDLGCGRGEFLALLRDNGIDGRGVDINEAMVEVCRSQGFDVTRTDALSYLEAQPDGSIGGLFAAQVVEHLEPQYLNTLLDVAFGKLRPGAPIVLETINPRAGLRSSKATSGTSHTCVRFTPTP